jgi:hypothetical protein
MAEDAAIIENLQKSESAAPQNVIVMSGKLIARILC